MEQLPSPEQITNDLYSASTTPIKQIPSELRPREALMTRGAAALSDEALLAILLRSGTPKMNVMALARELLLRSSGFGALAKLEYQELQALNIKGFGKVKAMELAAALEIGRRIAAQYSTDDMPILREPAAVYKILAPLSHDQEQEVFWMLLLDTKNRLIARPGIATRGLLNSSQIDPREVFVKAVRHKAASLIIAHNHPSGDPTPSPEDVAVTRRLLDASQILGIPLLDHLILGKPTGSTPGYVSLRERGLLKFG